MFSSEWKSRQGYKSLTAFGRTIPSEINADLSRLRLPRTIPFEQLNFANKSFKRRTLVLRHRPPLQLLRTIPSEQLSFPKPVLRTTYACPQTSAASPAPSPQSIPSSASSPSIPRHGFRRPPPSHLGLACRSGYYERGGKTSDHPFWSRLGP